MIDAVCFGLLVFWLPGRMLIFAMRDSALFRPRKLGHHPTLTKSVGFCRKLAFVRGFEFE